MSIATELQNYADGLGDAYDAVNDMSGIIPQHKNMNNLDQAIRTIPQNTGTTYTAGNGINIDANNEISIDNTVVPEFSDLATVATTGNYSDLSGTPTIPTKTSDLVNDGADNTSTYVEANELATVATSGLYSDLTGTPSLATVATSGDYGDLLNKPTIPAAQVNSDWDAASGVAQILNKPSLATVATSGSYNDLSNKPTIPAAQVNSDWNSNSGVSEILNKPSLATVATSGDYDDLLNKPTIPSYSDFTGATSSTAGAHGLVPAPAAGDDTKYLKGDGTWGTPADAGGVLIGYVNAPHAPASSIPSGTISVYRDSSYTAGNVVTPQDVDTALLAGKNVYFKFNDGDYYMKIITQVHSTYYAVSMGYDTENIMYGGPAGWNVKNAVNGFKSVNNATLTIQHNGTDVQTFTANASSNATANIETIYADTVAPASSVAPISTTSIQDGAVTFSKLGITTENVTNWKSGFSGTLTVMTIGKLHFLTGQVSGTLSSSAYNTVATLPASAIGGTIPGLEACGCARAQDYPCTITISGSGDIVLRPAGGTPVWARITMMWITN